MSQLPIKIHLPDGFLDEEIRNGYTISHEMKEIWAVELDLLAEFDKVCKENGLKYFMESYYEYDKFTKKIKYKR